MEYRVLGPLEVIGEEGPLPLGGAKQRVLPALPAALASEAGDTLKRPRLPRKPRTGHDLKKTRVYAYCVAGLAAVAAAAGDTERAGVLWGARQALERELKYPVLQYERELYDGLIDVCSENHPTAFAEAFEHGAQMSYDEIIDYALRDET